MLRYLRTVKNIFFRPLVLDELPIHLQISPTSFCNLACKMCPHDEDITNPKHIDFELYKKVIDEVKPKYLSLTGYGEPLMNPQFVEMIKYAKRYDAKVTTVSNCTIMSSKINNLVESGINLIKISLDGATKETVKKIRGQDIFDKIIENIKQINKTKKKLGSTTPYLRINFVLQKDNYKEVSKMVELAAKLEIDVLYLKPMHILKENQKKKLVIDWNIKDMINELEKARRIEGKLNIKTNLSTVVSRLKRVWETYDQNHSKKKAGHKGIDKKEVCLISWLSAYITSDGEVTSCCDGDFFRDERGPKLVFGNVKENSFSEIWNGKRYQNFRKVMRKGMKPYFMCQHCIPWSFGALKGYFTQFLPGWIK